MADIFAIGRGMLQRIQSVGSWKHYFFDSTLSDTKNNMPNMLIGSDENGKPIKGTHKKGVINSREAPKVAGILIHKQGDVNHHKVRILKMKLFSKSPWSPAGLGCDDSLPLRQSLFGRFDCVFNDNSSNKFIGYMIHTCKRTCTCICTLSICTYLNIRI